MLSKSDLDLLRSILRLAHAIEREARGTEGIDEIVNSVRVGELREKILDCENAESPDLKRLAKWADHLHGRMTVRHFYGILVPFERLSQKSVRDDEFLIEKNDRAVADRGRTAPLVAVLDNLRSAFNVGAIFRTAECMGLSEIVLCGYTPGPEDAKTARTAMGTGSDVPWRRFDRAQEACDVLKAEGYRVVALETVPTAAPLGEYRFPDRTALLLGNERFGLDPGTLALADDVCRIPVLGRKNSLNVGIAFGMAAFEFNRQLSGTK